MRLAEWCRADFAVAAGRALMYCMVHDTSNPDSYEGTEYAMLYDPAYSVKVPQIMGRYLRREISPDLARI